MFLEYILQLDSISMFFWMWPKNKRRDQREPKEPDMVAESEGSQVWDYHNLHRELEDDQGYISETLLPHMHILQKEKNKSKQEAK